MRQFLTAVCVILIVGLTLASGAIHGLISGRWGPSAELQVAADKLGAVPPEVGDWRLQSSEEMSAVALNQLQCAGYFIRRYVNRRTGETVNAALIVGPPVQTRLHTPDICYNGTGHEIMTEPKPTTVQDSNGSDHELFALTLQSKDIGKNLIRVYYGWSPGRDWSNLPKSRILIVGHPYLYKIQVAAHLSAGTDLKTTDPCRSFLRDFLPTVQDYLVIPSSD